MAYTTVHPLGIWALVRRQHGVIARWQLLARGFSDSAIRHRIATGRLHPLERGIYAVGRPEVSRDGELMAAVLASREQGWVSNETCAGFLGVRRPEPGPIHLSLPAAVRMTRPGVTVHRRTRRDELTVMAVRNIPCSTIPALIVDMALTWPPQHLEAAINQADAKNLLDAERMRRALNAFAGQPGVKPVRDLLDAATFLLTQSELERMFLRLTRSAGLPDPQTQRHVNGHRVDFIWAEAGLVVETDGLRYHRTQLEQRRDLERDQAHRRRGMVPLRFTHWQVRHVPTMVIEDVVREFRLAI